MSTLYPLGFPIVVLPTNPKVAPGGQVALQATGGSGAGYAWTIIDNQSGASLSGSTYTAGSSPNYVDTIQVTDSAGNVGQKEVRVLSGPTLADLRLEIQQRTDLVNSNFITTDEWNRYINAAAKKLYDLLVSAYSGHYNVAPPLVFETDGITERYPLPIDFYKLIGVDRQASNETGDWRPLRRLSLAERGQRRVASAGNFIQILYVPRPSVLVNDTDIVDGISGWEEYVKSAVAVKALNKREQDSSYEMKLMGDEEVRISVMAEDRNAGEPPTVADVRSTDLNPLAWFEPLLRYEMVGDKIWLAEGRFGMDRFMDRW